MLAMCLVDAGVADGILVVVGTNCRQLRLRNMKIVVRLIDIWQWVRTAASGPVDSIEQVCLEKGC